MIQTKLIMCKPEISAVRSQNNCFRWLDLVFQSQCLLFLKKSRFTYLHVMTLRSRFIYGNMAMQCHCENSRPSFFKLITRLVVHITVLSYTEFIKKIMTF